MQDTVGVVENSLREILFFIGGTFCQGRGEERYSADRDERWKQLRRNGIAACEATTPLVTETSTLPQLQFLECACGWPLVTLAQRQTHRNDPPQLALLQSTPMCQY